MRCLYYLLICVMFFSCDNYVNYRDVTVVNHICHYKKDMSLVTGKIKMRINSKLEERRYHKGKLHGEFHRWCSNGQLETRCSFYKGLLHGAYERWHCNGQLKFTGNYDKGKRSGLFKSYDDKGIIQHIKRY